MQVDARAVRVAHVARERQREGGGDTDGIGDGDDLDDNSGGVGGDGCGRQRRRGRRLLHSDARGDQNRPLCLLHAALLGRGGSRGGVSGHGTFGADASKAAHENRRRLWPRLLRPPLAKGGGPPLVRRSRGLRCRLLSRLLLRGEAWAAGSAEREAAEGRGGGVEQQERRGRGRRSSRRWWDGACRCLCLGKKQERRLSLFLSELYCIACKRKRKTELDL